ncbi:hypothetical protein PV327_007032 [Microctonus hyperodae]|uniref:Uncharacterized protein n=1 Tax=Microctonus hyperodae TaxID=165561 RepID=A0AA39F5L4_MICHY|nr:hypothetical protein PV327_007032 [Microctonus hyperodae]
MKRYITPTERTKLNSLGLKDLKKPFGFCCDISHQDPETQYDMRNPPFESSFAKIPLITNYPDVQFRVQDHAKIPVPTPRIARVYKEDIEIKKAATYGRSKKGRRPLTWYLEDEIKAAQDALAEEKKSEWKEKHEKSQKKLKRNRNSGRNSIEENENPEINENESLEIFETENPSITESQISNNNFNNR